MTIPVHKEPKDGFMGGVFFTGRPSLTRIPFPVSSGRLFPRLLSRPPKIMATQFPRTVAGATFVSMAEGSAPRAWAYISERGTVPAVMPPLVMGTPRYKIPPQKPWPRRMPKSPEARIPTAREAAATGRSRTVARSRSFRSMLNRLPVISAEI